MVTVAQSPPALLVENLTKQFGSNLALDNVSLEVPTGSIHALLGMNGSGKSTLVKILSGFYTSDGGQVTVDGKSLHDSDIAFVHQDLGLVDELSVLQNLNLGGTPPLKHGRIDTQAERENGRASLATFGLEGVVDMKLGELQMSEKTIVAIARALQHATNECKLLVLDEPTSTLPSAEASKLLEVMRGCAKNGISILFISHRLAEVISVADMVTVLRGGRVAHKSKVTDTSIEQIVSSMTGSELRTLEDLEASTAADVKKQDKNSMPVVLETSSLSGDVITEMDLEIRKGEIVGITGLLGSGIEEIGLLLSGRTKPRTGTISHLGNSLNSASARTVGYVTANRVKNSILPGFTTRENASFTTIKKYLKKGIISLRAEKNAMYEWFKELLVYPLDTEIGMLQLSGGNQQKVLFARWLATKPALLIAEEPAQGIDVHAKAQLLTKLREYAEDGLTVVLISGEPEEIIAACDRMIVLNEGRKIGELTAPISTTSLLSLIHKGKAND